MKKIIPFLLIITACTGQMEEKNKCGNEILERGEECELNEKLCNSSCLLSRRIFVTSEVYSLSEISIADDICEKTAIENNIKEKLTWKAWLSFNKPIDIFQSSEKYINLNNDIVAKNFNDLIDGSIDFTISWNEKIIKQDRSEVWTFTNEFGKKIEDCTFGLNDFIDKNWTNINIECVNKKHLYCIEDK